MRSKQSLHMKEGMLGIGFLVPSLVLFALFIFYPFIRSLYLSLQQTDLRGRTVKFVGLSNYTDLLTSEHFYHSLTVTCLFALMTIPTTILIALGLALLTQQRIKFTPVFQIIFAISLIIPISTSSVIWKLLFHPSLGIINYFLGFVGIRPVEWLTDPKMALVSVSIVTVWSGIGFIYVVLLSGIRGISAEIYESATIDGAGVPTVIRKITLPLLSPTLFFVSVVSVIHSLQSFGQFSILTDGGPAFATDVLVYDLYLEAFVNFRFGSGSAQAIVLFVILLIFTLIQFRFERRVHYS